jgi:hypothetical protein
MTRKLLGFGLWVLRSRYTRTTFLPRVSLTRQVPASALLIILLNQTGELFLKGFGLTLHKDDTPPFDLAKMKIGHGFSTLNYLFIVSKRNSLFIIT